MPFVEREGGVPGTGTIIGRYARPQPGKAEEWLDDAHADLQPTFAENQLAKLGQMSAEVTAFIYARYDQATQSSLGKFLVTAGNAGLTNRVAHISAAIDWVEDLLNYFYTCKAAILATTNQTELDAESWDFSTYDAAADPNTNADPLVTIESALAIAD